MRAIQQAPESSRRMVEAVQRLLNRRLLLVLMLLAILPPSIWGAIGAWNGMTSDAADWLPRKPGEAELHDRLKELFGNDELLMISWDGCSLDDPRIETYRQALLAEVDTPQGPASYYRRVISAPELLEFYESAPLSLSREQAIEKMHGWLVSPDGKHAGVIALVSEAGEKDREAAIDYTYTAAGKVEGLSPGDLYVAGPTINGVAVDRASQSYLLELNLVSFGVCILILLVLQRSLRVALLVFSTALFNEQLTMALIHYGGTTMDPVLLLSANLTFVLSISVGVHLVNYYRDALEHVPANVAPAWGCYLAAKPTLLATLTTSLGLASLQVSEIRPITKFGFYSSIAVIAAALFTALLISLHFTIWPLKPRQKTETRANDSAFSGYVAFLNRARWPIVLLAVAGLVAGYFGATRLKSMVGLHELLSHRSRVVQDYDRLESEIGPLTPIEVVIRTPPGNAKVLLKQFRAIEQVHQSLAGLSDQYAVLSIRNFSPPAPPERGGLVMISKRAVFRKTLLENQEKLKEMGYLVVLPDTHYWRLTVRCPSSQSLRFGQIIADIRRTVEATLAEQPDFKTHEVIVGGSVPMIVQTQQQMLTDLVNSFFWAFGMVAVVLMLVFRSVLCGLLCMIPNVLPCAVAFGTMGYAGVPVDLGTILTASAALGIAVDDSMHFITWFQSAASRGATAQQAVRHAFRHCAMAMIQTTLICGLGLVVFFLSGFLPISNFGTTMFVLLFLALAADLMCLPALLLTPLGQPFLKRKDTPPSDTP